MLFFKDIREEFLENPEFKAFYEKECHICHTTAALVSRLTRMGEEGKALLKRLDISEEAYSALALGDCCNPEEVARIAAALGMEAPGQNCPRR